LRDSDVRTLISTDIPADRETDSKEPIKQDFVKTLTELKSIILNVDTLFVNYF